MNYSFKHLTQTDGLLHNQVFSIVQDAKGFIWIATANGLQRYDGSRFIYYPEMLSSPLGMLTNAVNMYADNKNNRLWISNDNKLEKMETEKNKFTVYNKEKLITDTAFTFTSYRDADNKEWRLSSNALYQYNSSLKKYFSNNLNVLPANSHYSTSIAADSTTNITWVITNNNLYLFDKKSKKVYSAINNPENNLLLKFLKNNLQGKNLRFIMIDSRQNFWISTWADVLFRYDNKTKKISQYNLSDIKMKAKNNLPTSSGIIISCMMEDDHNNNWLATEGGGLLRYNEDQDNFDYCIAEEKNSETIRYNFSIYCLFQDKEQNIWLGTDKGISIFNPYRKFFNAVRHEKNNPLSITKNEITSAVQTTSGDIIIGTWGGGITVYDEHLNFKKNILFKGLPPHKNFTWSLIQVDEETLWTGCQHGYLQQYNLVSGAVQTFHPPEMEGSTIMCMEKDSKGNVFFGLHNGKIVKWNKQQQKFYACRDTLKKADNVSNIFIDKDQQCWVSTIAGFKQFDTEKMIYTSIWLPDENNVKALSGQTCRGIEELNDSLLLIGTIYGGLNFFNKKTKTFSQVTMANGLPSNNIYAIKKDTAGKIWFTSDYGLCKYIPSEKKIILFGMEPGLVTSTFSSNKFYPLQNGQWLTFTGTEIISFFTGNPGYGNINKPKIEITGFEILGKAVSVDSLLYNNNPLRLSYKENFITIEFASLSFSGVLPTNYYYRLEGVDKNWVNGGTKRFANYTSLQPGEYIFEVKAEQGNNTGAITSFKIIITPPLWKTTWFKILCALLITGIIYSIAKWRMNAVRNEAKNKMLFAKQMAEMEMKALRSQMNPHFIFNCINSIDALIQGNDKYSATVYLNKFAKLLRNILDTSKQNTVLFSKDVDTLKLYIELEELRHENKFKTTFNIDSELLNSDYKVPPLIVQPFAENAILHGLKNKEGNDGILIITIKKVNDTIQYTITDNGIGRKAAGEIMQNKESHHGMQISYDRIKLFNKEEHAAIQINDLYNNGKATGTEVTVNLNII
ncbi:ligand-binding sensor domain-containing protein [Ferruginibacter sp.]